MTDKLKSKGKTLSQIMSEESDAAKTAQDFVKYWLNEIKEALKREKDYRKSAQTAQNLYDIDGRDGSDGNADVKSTASYNILYANTEVMSPALYNATPRPQVRRRFQNLEQVKDPVGAAASLLCERVLSYFMDTDLREYPSFDEAMTDVVQSALVPGRGILRFRYDAKFEPETPEDEAAETPETQAMEQAEGTEGPGEIVTEETVCWETVPWDRFCHGFSRKWSGVPWVAFEHFFSKEEAEEAFGKELVAAMDSVTLQDDASDDSKGEPASEGVKFWYVWEIWHKASGKVFFISPQHLDGVLKKVDDPLKLSGFFPMPEPLKFVKRIKSLVPQTLYAYYQSQAEELNSITTRLKFLIKGLKVRGGYNAMVEGIENILEAEDNTLKPVNNVAALGDSGALEKAVMFVPIEKHAQVVMSLYEQRQQIKSVIYEITGIMDLMRGSSQASETLGAQQLKNQWGSVRLKRLQNTVAKNVRESLRIVAEIAFTKLSPETIKEISGTQLPLRAEKEKAVQTYQQWAQQQQQQMALQQQQAAAAGMQLPTPPAQPQQPPPELMAVINSPALEDVIDLLKSDLQRSYRIDIETNSTVDLESTEDKQDMAELMNAIAQFLNGVAPAVEQGILPFDAAKAMLIGIVRKFRFGQDIEKLIETMQPPAPKQDDKPKGDSPEVIQAQQQLKMTEAQVGLQKSQQQMQLEQQKHKNELEKMQMEMEQAKQKHQMEMAKLLLSAQQPAAQPPQN